MEKNQAGIWKRWSAKLYGGLTMRWPVVIAFAVCAAVVTAVFLIVPLFKDTSFARMGVTFEAWIFFAVIIMANCKKPLESALKVFVFFLISQPLIYLLQVPFSWMGWGLFGYYRYWFIWTLLTFPMALIGWYITKKDWLALLILAPVLFLLTHDYVSAFSDTLHHFPRLLVTALFCLGQVLLYLCTFTKTIWQKLLGFFVPLTVVVVLLLVRPQVQINGNSFLPDDPVLTEDAVVTVEDAGNANVSIERTGENSMVRIQADAYGTTSFEIRDGDNVYRYTLEIYEDENGSTQTRITPENAQNG